MYFEKAKRFGEILLEVWMLLRDHSYITSSHFLDFWTPLPPYVSMFLVLRISKNWPFLTPLPPSSADVIYEWSLTLPPDMAVNSRSVQSIIAFPRTWQICNVVCMYVMAQDDLKIQGGGASNVVGTICPHPLVEIGLTALPGISNTPKSDIPVCMYIELYVCSRKATCHYINPVHFIICLLFV